jgi:squalene synthase HpnC
MAAEPGYVERPADVGVRRGKQEMSRLCQSPLRLHEGAEGGRIDESDLAEVDDQPGRRLTAGLLECASDLRRVVEVELTGEPDDDDSVPSLDGFHRRAPQSLTFPPLHFVRSLSAPRLTQQEGFAKVGGVNSAAQALPAEVAVRARAENFPVASLLFPRPLRPHLRAIYGFARLVDILGDEAEGDRLALLDELESEVAACYDGSPTWPVMKQLQPTIQAVDLLREPFLRLIEANRMDQRISEYETWADLKHYCVHSADPVGRLVLGVLRLDRDEQLVAASDNVCTGLQLVNFLQDVPRDLALGRIYLPADDRREFGVTVLDRPGEPLTRLLRFEAERARELLAAGETLRARIGGRVGRAVGLFARGGLAALAALEEAGWDIFTQRPRPSRLRLAREALRR